MDNLGNTVLQSYQLSANSKTRACNILPPQLYVFVSIVLPGLVLPRLRPGRSALLPELGLRAAAVTTSFLLAALVPYLDLFISLAGALCMSTLSLVCPAIIGKELLKVPAHYQAQQVLYRTIFMK